MPLRRDGRWNENAAGGCILPFSKSSHRFKIGIIATDRYKDYWRKFPPWLSDAGLVGAPGRSPKAGGSRNQNASATSAIPVSS